jgi:hypothetical protein
MCPNFISNVLNFGKIRVTLDSQFTLDKYTMIRHKLEKCKILNFKLVISLSNIPIPMAQHAEIKKKSWIFLSFNLVHNYPNSRTVGL